MIEIFFGPTGSDDERLSLARFLKASGFQYYIYGPKADSHLRKAWTGSWPQEYVRRLQHLAVGFRDSGLRFGVALSPFGLHERSARENERLLIEKVKILNGIGVEDLGLFFDDMPSHADLAGLQLQATDTVLTCSKARLIFCPSYYSFDPILDKVFGPRPARYLETLARHLPPQVEILWTGDRVISPEITAEHLHAVSGLLRRKPFICDNFFANDGPKNCKFLKLKALTGRSFAAFASAGSWAFNPMNQLELSKIVLFASSRIARGLETDPDQALDQAIDAFATPGFASFLRREREFVLMKGLDAIEDPVRGKWVSELKVLPDPAAREIREWVSGKYVVGNECLTD